MPTHNDSPFVVVTRPPPGLEATCQQVQANGWRVIAHPMLQIAPLYPQLPNENFDALVVSSSQVIHALDDLSREITVYAVGAATAKRLRAAGFYKVVTCSGTSSELYEKITSRHASQRILFPTGVGLGHALTHALRQRDRMVTRIETYRSQPVEQFSPSLIKHVQNKEVASVLFFSTRTAEAWTAAAFSYQISTNDVHALALSDNVAKGLSAQNWARVTVSKTPDQPAMLAALGTPHSDDGRNLA